MKRPPVPPVKPPSLVLPNEFLEPWNNPSTSEISSNAVLSPAEADSINGMTLETSRRLTAAVTNLAAFFSSDPEFADIVKPYVADVVSIQNAPVSAKVPVVPGSMLRMGAASVIDAIDEQTAGEHTKENATGVGRAVTRNPQATTTSLPTKAVASPSESLTQPVTGAVVQPNVNASAEATRTGDARLPSDRDTDRSIEAAVRNADPSFAAQRGELQAGGSQRSGDGSGNGTNSGTDSGTDSGTESGEQLDGSARSTNIEGAAIPKRQQGALPVVPFNRRLETNGVDQTRLLETEFSANTRAYAGADPNWIMPLTIGAPRMSTDGGASPPPMQASDDTEDAKQASQKAPSADLVTARLATPLIMIQPAPARRSPRLRRRHRLAARLFRRLFSVRQHYDAPSIKTNFSLSDPRLTRVVECAACWVGSDSNRREQWRLALH